MAVRSSGCFAGRWQATGLGRDCKSQNHLNSGRRRLHRGDRPQQPSRRHPLPNISAARHLFEFTQGGCAEGRQAFTARRQGDQVGMGGVRKHFTHPVLHVPDQRGDHDIGMAERWPASIGCGKAARQFVKASAGLAKAAVKPCGASMLRGMEVPFVDHGRDLFERALGQRRHLEDKSARGPGAGDQRCVTRLLVEVVEDRSTVDQHLAVVQDEGRNASQGGLIFATACASPKIERVSRLSYWPIASSRARQPRRDWRRTDALLTSRGCPGSRSCSGSAPRGWSTRTTG